MKVWVVFKLSLDIYEGGDSFEAVCSSEEAAKSFIRNTVTAEARSWTWMEKRYQDVNIESSVTEQWECREIQVID